MDEERDPRTTRLRALLTLLSSTVALVVRVLQDAPALDVALWAVLTGIVVAGSLELLPLLRRQASVVLRPRSRVVVPDAVAATPPTPDPAVQARAAIVERVRAQLLEAKQSGAGLDELLPVARALHEAELDLARATVSAGGHVPQSLRDELLLRDRRTTVPSTT